MGSLRFVVPFFGTFLGDWVGCEPLFHALPQYFWLEFYLTKGFNAIQPKKSLYHQKRFVTEKPEWKSVLFRFDSEAERFF